MPRKNPKQNITRKIYNKPSDKKKRYGSREQALKAAEDLMLLKPELVLEVYQDIDLGWYLTSKAKYF